jgi:hypothetical protein
MVEIWGRFRKTGIWTIIFVIFTFSDHYLLFGQTETYSPYSQSVLDEYYSGDQNNDTLEVFSFSILNELNSLNEPVFEGDGDPSLYGQTKYGSEFKLENNLGNLLTIEIPSFVIDSLAEDSDGNYFPVVKNGDNFITTNVTLSTVTDDELNTTTNQYTNTDGVDITEIISPEGITKTYDNDDDLSVNIFSTASTDVETGEAVETTNLNYDNASG